MKLRTPSFKTILIKYPKGSILQEFGENVELYKIIPQPTGIPQLTGGHPGIDLYHGYAEPHRSPSEDTCWVVDVKYSPEGYGEHIRFLVQNQDEGGYLEVTYGHCAEIEVKIGDVLKSNIITSYEGNSGVVFCQNNQYWGKSDPHKCGTHVHVGVRHLVEYNPMIHPNYIVWLDKKYFVLDYNNGTHGFINPRKYMDLILPLPIVVSETNNKDIQISIYRQLVELYKKLIQLLLK